MPYRDIVVISADGETTQSFLPKDDLAILDTLRLIVGGPIAVVPLPNQKYMVINEEAKYAEHHINNTATSLAHAAETIPAEDYIAGIAVIVDSAALDIG